METVVTAFHIILTVPMVRVLLCRWQRVRLVVTFTCDSAVADLCSVH
jgi:hypothetical protein